MVTLASKSTPYKVHLDMTAWNGLAVLPFPNNIDPSNVANHICAQNHIPSPVSRKNISTLRKILKHAWLQQSLEIGLGLEAGLVHLARWGPLEVAKSKDLPEKPHMSLILQVHLSVSNLASRESTGPRATTLIPALVSPRAKS